MANLVNCLCITCGIEFGLPTAIVAPWKSSGKNFFCPNGHGLSWPKDGDSAEHHELKALRVEVQELKTKLEAALKAGVILTKKVDELTLELEIWVPTVTEDIPDESQHDGNTA